jgi:hypothetical protein
MNNQSEADPPIDWEAVILQLQVFTRRLVKGKGWFRGNDTATYIKGKEIDDYVFGAIEKYLQHPEKYDPSKGDFIDYLKFNLISSLVINDALSSENKTSSDIFGVADDIKEGDDNSGTYLDSVLPHAEAYFDQEIDYQEIMSDVEQEVKKDKTAEDIFLALNIGFKRIEIIKEFQLDEKTYNNGLRRLNTILANVAAKFDLKRPSA